MASPAAGMAPGGQSFAQWLSATNPNYMAQFGAISPYVQGSTPQAYQAGLTNWLGQNANATYGMGNGVNLPGQTAPIGAGAPQNSATQFGVPPIGPGTTPGAGGTSSWSAPQTPLAQQNPAGWSGAGTAPGGPNAAPGATPQTLGAAASATPGGLGTIPLPSSSSGYGLDVSAYQNPMAQTMQDWANKALQGTYAASGDLLSGPAMQGITQFNQQAALNNSYAPALAAAMQQQGTGIGLDQYNQQFAYNQALNNQTIPWAQQMQLANLGLAGTQGQQSVTDLLAQLQAQLAQSAGQAAGSGTQGGASALTGGANAGLQNYLQQYLLSQILGGTR
jgi:hypothetical protein